MDGNDISPPPNGTEEKWIFSLNLPFADHPKMEIVTFSSLSDDSHRRTNNINENSNGGGDDDDDMFSEVFPPAELKSLLDGDDDDDDRRRTSSSSCCWKYVTPQGQSLESSILLKLSYRPAWQGIPEYTTTSKQRRLAQACCCGNGGGGGGVSHQAVGDDEQIWEIYTTKQIVKTERRQISIRGIGPCQAIRVFLKPLSLSSSLSSCDDGDDFIPNSYRTSYELHRERMGKQPSKDWTRYTQQPDDTLSLPVDSSSTTSSACCIVVTFAVPIMTMTAEDEASSPFSSYKYDPPLLWKVDIPKITQSDGDVVLDTITVLDGSVDLKESPTHAYINGYQSWSFSGSVQRGQKQPQPALPDTFSKAFNLGGLTCNPPTVILPRNNNTTATTSRDQKMERAYKSDFFTCITTDRNEVMDEYGGPALVIGWLSQHEQLGIITMDGALQSLDMHATHGAHLVEPVTSTDWAFAQVVAPHYYDEEPMAHYLHSVGAFNEAAPLQNGPIAVGWCSWYHYYENISEQSLRENFSRLAGIKKTIATNLAVVDDGYMTAWGDWDSLKPGKFSDMANVCQDIVSNGMRPGIWLAPFAADKHSALVKRHPEWVIRNDQGQPANSSNCGKFFYGLDATNPHVRQYVFECIRRAVQDWGFKVLKIDFLYAACLEGNGKYDLSMTRAQAMHLALQTIREAAGPDVFLIGCGCPIGVAIGYVDGMRVSADTGPTWYPSFPLPWWDQGTLPSLRGMIRNSMSRSTMGHRWWHNDPDCLQMGNTTSLTDEEVSSAASIVAMTCGMMLLSDDLTKLGKDRMKILTKIYPMTGVSGVVLDLHSTNDNGMPSIIKLWCTDTRDSLEKYRISFSSEQLMKHEDSHNHEATHFAKQTSFHWEEPLACPSERSRNCIHMAKGLGTWNVISLSNWTDKSQVMHIPRTAIEWKPPENERGYRIPNQIKSSTISNEYGWHVFSFWSRRYSWIASSQVISESESIEPLSRHLGIHETEIFHFKAVTPRTPQYIGSDLHFSCGHEVLSFDPSKKNKVLISLKREMNRTGHVYLFVPTVDTSHVRVFLANFPTRWSVVGSTPLEGGSSHCCGRIIKVEVFIKGDRSESDGELVVEY